ncbi:hypothetical protein HY993_03910 [Candidatus Micrarchaeota archaeon]|nr:hypothetical protein [Candidatus Micrarchaeota archaeon]
MRKIADLDSIIEKAREYAISEILEYGTPAIEGFELSNQKGAQIAGKLGADKQAVLLGTIFMDLKLGECMREGKLGQHVERSANAARKFLEENGVDPKTVEKIVGCVLNHHGAEKFPSLEAELR